MKKHIGKLLGQPVATTPTESLDASSFDTPQLRPLASQNGVYATGAPLACLDRSADGQRTVIAGAKVFRILKVEGSAVSEDIDLRSIISKHAQTHNLSVATPDQLNIRAVKWAHGVLDTTIVTACLNGRITVYDLNKAAEGLEVARIHEHARPVHKLDINPNKSEWLLSASQDGTVKLHDLKVPMTSRSGPTFKTVQTFRCNADVVRDVKWRPGSGGGYEFACCTDAGTILKWDMRKSQRPLLKLGNAHGNRPCLSIAWHPHGSHLASGGLDQTCHVWDMRAERNQKPKYTFATPAPVSSISWRPACWSATAQGNRAAQVATAYDDLSTNRYQTSTMHIWDLARPSMPFKEIEVWDSSPSGHLWNTQDLLWSVDKDGNFTQTDIAYVPKTIERRSLSNFTFSPTGNVLMLLEERPASQRRSRPSITSPEVSPSFHHVASTPQFGLSQSDSEEDVVGSFLGPRLPKGHRRRHSGRLNQSLSTTPPSVSSSYDNKVMPLEDAVSVTGLYKPQQVMAIGHAPSTVKKQAYQYFTNRYLQRLIKPTTSEPDVALPNVRIPSILEYFGRSAEKVGQYRLAQTWRLIGYTMGLLLTRRAEYHRKQRLAADFTPKKKIKKDNFRGFSNKSDRGEETPRKLFRSQTPRDSPRQRPMKAIIPEETESTSNVATPLVRPRSTSIFEDTKDNMEADALELPAPAVQPSTSPSPIPVPGAHGAEDERTSSVEGYDFYGLDSYSPEVDFHPPRRKQPLRLDYSSRNAPLQRMTIQRHDSGESFEMFSSSGDSHQAKFMGSSSSGQGQSLRDRVSSWENSFPSAAGHRPSVGSDISIHLGHSDERKSPESQGSSARRSNGSSFNPALPPMLRLQEASMSTILTENNETEKSAAEMQAQSQSPESESEGLAEWEGKASEDPNLIESDFLSWPKDPAFLIKAIDPTGLVQREINFQAQQTGALNAAAMILLLRPYLPASSIDPIQANAIIKQLHHRLTALKLFSEAALLRSVAYPTYPSIADPSQYQLTIGGFFCTDCNKPLDPDPLIRNSLWRCPRCQRIIDACVICRQRDLEPGVGGAVWFLCPGCGHGGHTACMQEWHDSESEGSCPLEGCLHPCLPGPWRERRSEEKKVAQERDLAAAVRNGVPRIPSNRNVRRDQREVRQSQAVEGVRVALGVGQGLGRSKSVKLVAPGEEGR